MNRTFFNISIAITMLSLLSFMVSSCSLFSGQDGSYTRGVGVYPGRTDEDAAPQLKEDKAYRNIALHKTVYQSSSFDYNLTGFLVTDGIISEGQVPYLNIFNNDVMLERREREWFFDGKPDSKYRIQDPAFDMRIATIGMTRPVDSIAMVGTMTYDPKAPKGYELNIYGKLSTQETWVLLRTETGKGLPGVPYGDPSSNQRAFSFILSGQLFPPYLEYLFSIKTEAGLEWAISDWNFYSGGRMLSMLASQFFHSTWVSDDYTDEWLVIDFGAPATFDKVNLYWSEQSFNGKLEVSNDNQTWEVVSALKEGRGQKEKIELDKEAHGRYLRISLDNIPTRNTSYHFELSEVEVFGRGGLEPVPKEMDAPKDGKWMLSGGNWKILRASQVKDDGLALSQPNYEEQGPWIPATVPGTVLMSYRNVGNLPDPNYADNQLLASESFFYSDFWYRNVFTIPKDFAQDLIFLNFDGINWKADVFFNGIQLDRIEGAFIRQQYDITPYIKKGQPNALAVRIIRNANPGAVKEQNKFSPDQNGGILGADNPTFHASVGWDWIPTIRGRNIGIWNDVYVSTTGPVTVSSPLVQTALNLPDTTQAHITISAVLHNKSTDHYQATFSGQYAGIPFSADVHLQPGEERPVSATIDMENPALWWPRGYGQPHLYDVSLEASVNNHVSDRISFKSGVRQMDFNEDNGVLSLFINGRRFVGRGGNWGFSESNLLYRNREYDAAVAYHADMNFTMIRNWVGMTGDDEFYDACDKHGIMVWQDFWLANPWDGPVPNDNRMFIANAIDMIKRIRNHPSIALYCGRNEGNPPIVLDDALRAITQQLHPDIHYISHSSAGIVSGGGPYRALPVSEYFQLFGNDRFHSERGMPNVMTYESLAQTIPEDKIWPQNDLWGIHDYTLNGAQGAASFNQIIETAFGPISDARQFTERAQWINYDGYRGIFEGRSQYRRGMLLWMSHPAWPSMVWQTYDYYFEPTAAYFGCKKACEPLHIQWNPVTDVVEVVNISAGTQQQLETRAQVLNMDGSVQWEMTAQLAISEDQTITCFPLVFPTHLSATHFINLTLKDNGHTVSENFYVRGLEPGNYQALNELPKTTLNCETRVEEQEEGWMITCRLHNQSTIPALMNRLMVVGARSGQRILPALYSDNYVSLMPNAQKELTITVKKEDCRGEKPTLVLTGFNLK